MLYHTPTERRHNGRKATMSSGTGTPCALLCTAFTAETTQLATTAGPPTPGSSKTVLIKRKQRVRVRRRQLKDPGSDAQCEHPSFRKLSPPTIESDLDLVSQRPSLMTPSNELAVTNRESQRAEGGTAPGITRSFRSNASLVSPGHHRLTTYVISGLPPVVRGNPHLGFLDRQQSQKDGGKRKEDKLHNTGFRRAWEKRGRKHTFKGFKKMKKERENKACETARDGSERSSSPVAGDRRRCVTYITGKQVSRSSTSISNTNRLPLRPSRLKEAVPTARDGRSIVWPIQPLRAGAGRRDLTLAHPVGRRGREELMKTIRAGAGRRDFILTHSIGRRGRERSQSRFYDALSHTTRILPLRAGVRKAGPHTNALSGAEDTTTKARPHTNALYWEERQREEPTKALSQKSSTLTAGAVMEARQGEAPGAAHLQPAAAFSRVQAAACWSGAHYLPYREQAGWSPPGATPSLSLTHTHLSA
ncbi:hypothetical protein RRG08_030509 [Elysia crispata]|uniref:Uncharacterized protein n=1 Tax=Elysia crispata TaxID=231223 RepID=A0AAE1ALY8_9GAST|nr:hypothetical protein RRG08_030509 [Elysia crispata]